MQSGRPKLRLSHVCIYACMHFMYGVLLPLRARFGSAPLFHKSFAPHLRNRGRFHRPYLQPPVLPDVCGPSVPYGTARDFLLVTRLRCPPRHNGSSLFNSRREDGYISPNTSSFFSPRNLFFYRCTTTVRSCFGNLPSLLLQAAMRATKACDKRGWSVAPSSPWSASIPTAGPFLRGSVGRK